MAVLGGGQFLMSEVPLYQRPTQPTRETSPGLAMALGLAWSSQGAHHHLPATYEPDVRTLE
eukprot:CAMPEP_0180208562 /NCGR_PEP_ID=MMETSP0987-20121128/10846_1 /TAXON_ID=697907 /ORGANISM="non described non described, Strain CCMP2293" /LENGTH=60 /DNA_ID=CAMNT_0022164797 /DNA_START=56 /DNA_END=239 /DNA_ORIENTATION=+